MKTITLKIREILLKKPNLMHQIGFDTKDTLIITYKFDEEREKQGGWSGGDLIGKGTIKPLFKLEKELTSKQVFDLLRKLITEKTLSKNNHFSQNSQFYKPFIEDLKSDTKADEYAIIIHSDQSYDDFYERFYN